MRLKAILDNLLIMTKAERNGSFVLLSILFILILIRIASPYFVKEDTSYYEEIERKIAILELQKDSLNNIEVEKNNTQIKATVKNNYFSKKESSDTEREVNYFAFDPNTVSYSQLLSLGLTKNTASTFIKFRSKGAKFYKSEDLLKVYGIDSTIYKKLLSYISISPPENNFIRIKSAPQKVLPISIEINSADSADWVTLSGIGPVYASRICKFRNNLGGYVSIDQLKEVYHLPQETFDKIYNNLSIDTTLVKHININFADIEELKRHPYCDYSTAREIVNYRAKNGSYLSIIELLSDSVLSINDFKRLSPYFTVDK